MSTTFAFNGDATIKHLNIRKEGDEEKVLKVDMKVDADCGMDVIDYLDTGLRHFLWSTQGIVRNPLIKDIGYQGEVADCDAEVEGLHFTGVRVHKFNVSPKDSLRATVSMTLTFEPSSTDVAILAERVHDPIKLGVKAAPSLLDNATAAGEGKGPVMEPAQSDDDLLATARAVVLEHKRASISLVQRHLRIGYNRAARLMEALEKNGVLSAMKSDGSREILALAMT